LHSAAVSLTILQYYHNECGLYLEKYGVQFGDSNHRTSLLFYFFGAKLVVVNS
jgi:hypothetical protein